MPKENLANSIIHVGILLSAASVGCWMECQYVTGYVDTGDGEVDTKYTKLVPGARTKKIVLLLGICTIQFWHNPIKYREN